MDNHIHLLIRSSQDELASFFQSLGTRFVRWYNNKYSRSGHLFQDRFYSVAIENDNAFLSALAYIHNNPVKANIIRCPSEYRWSSFNAYYGAKNPLVDVLFAYKISGSKESLLRFFSKEQISFESELFIDDHRETAHYYTDEKALSIFKSETGLSSTSEVINVEKTKRNEYIRVLRKKGLTIKQVARIMDISETTVKRISKMDR